MCDLFLDTPAFVAHTTGSDALWAGLPFVTIAGCDSADCVIVIVIVIAVVIVIVIVTVIVTVIVAVTVIVTVIVAVKR